MISSVNFSNTNQTNQNNKKSQNVNFSSVHFSHLPSKYKITSKNTLQMIISNYDDEMENLFRAFEKIIQKITSKQGIENKPPMQTIITTLDDVNPLFVCYTGKDARQVRPKNNYSMTEIQHSINTARSLVKQKGIAYEVADNNSFKIIG